MSNQLYANGRIAVMSTKLLGADKFSRLADCLTLGEALKVLSECGYGVSVEANGYEEVLNAQADANVALLKELCFNQGVLNYFSCQYDYHNAKVLMKRKYARIDGTDGCFEHAKLSAQAMAEGMVNDDYSQLSPIMAEACDAVDFQFAQGNRSPQVVDRILDVACFAEMRECANKCKVPLIKRLCQWHADTTNLMLVCRLQKAGRTQKDLDDWFVVGGTLSKQNVFEFWNGAALTGELGKFAEVCKKDLSSAEELQREGRNKIVAEYADSLTIQPVVAYYFRKQDEIDKVRRILIAVKNGTNKSVNKKR